MKFMKKCSICLCLCLFCLLGLTGMKSRAAEIIDRQIFLNPEFESEISKEEIEDLQDLPLTLSGDEEVVYYTSIQDAALALRRQWVERKEVIIIGLRRDDYYSGLPGEIMKQAVEHTGVPTEGDYLSKQYGSIGVSVEAYQSGNERLYKLIYQMGYRTNAAMEAEMNSRLAAVMQSLNLDGKDEYTKAKAIYDYICSNITYDYEHLGNSSYDLQYTAYAALINKTAVCNGYAVLFYRMALMAGLDCRYISGVTDDGGAHGWNIVKINGRYYNLDATWDAGKVSSGWKWFLKCTATFTDHNRNEEYISGNFNLQYPMGIADYGTNVTEELAVSGTCGTNLTWALDGNQVLTITGSGAMQDYSDALPAPWSRLNIRKVVLNGTITRIGNKAFAYHTELTEVIFPAGLTVIGKEAFSGCTALGSVSFPQTLTEIGEKAFYRCSAIKSLSIPGNVNVIGEKAFAKNEGITVLVLGNGIKTLELGAFMECTALQSISYPVSITEAAEGIFSSCGQLKNVTFTGNGIIPVCTTDQKGAWNRSTVTNVVIENGITEIGDYAFYQAVGIQNVSIAESVKTIRHGAFYGASSLTEVIFPASVETIEGYAFIYCENLKSLELPKEIQSVGEFAFYDCNNLETLVIPVTAGNVVSSAFMECDNLKKVTITGTGTMPDYEKSTDAPWGRIDSMQEVVIESGVTSIGRMAFYNKDALEKVTIPETVTKIGEQAFAFCDILSNMDLPDNLKEIEKWAFYDCKKLVIKEKTGSVAGDYAVANKLNFQSTGLMTPAWKNIQNTAKGIKLSWNKVSGASGYRIYRRSGNGEWKKLANIKSGSKTSYVDTSVKSGTFYAYRICALKKGKIASDYSLTNANSVYLSVPKLTEVKNTSGKKLQVKWKKVKGIGGYEIRYVTGKTVKTVQVKKNKVSKVLSGLKKKKTYKISIRTYKKVNNVVWYSAWSNVKKVKVTR